VVVMSQGQVEQVNEPAALYARPESRFVFDFLGHVNVLEGSLKNQKLTQGDAWVSLPSVQGDREAQLYMRPHEVQLARSPSAHARLPLRIESVSLIGSEVRIELQPEGWHSNELWEVGMSHNEFARQAPARGDLWYAVPDIGHLFTDAGSQPRTVDWHYPTTATAHP